MPSETAFDGPEGLDRLLSGVGPISEPDSHPRAVKSRAIQVSKVTKLILRFLRDILSTSSRSIVRRVGVWQSRDRGTWEFGAIWHADDTQAIKACVYSGCVGVIGPKGCIPSLGPGKVCRRLWGT